MKTAAKYFCLNVLVCLSITQIVRAQSPDLEALRKDIETYKVLPKFVPPGSAFDAKKLMQNKTIISIPVSSSIPFITTLEQAFSNVSNKGACKCRESNNQGLIP